MSIEGLNIAVVGPLPPPSGGMANQALQLSELLEQFGANVLFVRVNAPYRPSLISNIKGVRALFRLVPYLYTLWRTTRSAQLVHVLANSGWSWHLYAAPAVWIARWCGKPVMINYRGGEADKFFARSWRWIKPTMTQADSICVPSGFLEDIFASYGIKAETIPNILNLERFSMRDGSQDFNDAPHIVITRNLEPLYDVATSIRAFKQIQAHFSRARMTVAGSGPELEPLQRLVDELGLKTSVKFAGRLSNEEIAALYQTADLMLNSSLEDNSPNSLIEAMASGVPVVSSDVGGISYLIDDGIQGRLVAPENPELLAQVAIDVLSDKVIRQNLVNAGITRINKFDKTRVAELLTMQYQNLLGAS